MLAIVPVRSGAKVHELRHVIGRDFPTPNSLVVWPTECCGRIIFGETRRWDEVDGELCSRLASRQGAIR